MTHNTRPLLALAASLILCSAAIAAPPLDETGCATAFDPDADYFPDKAGIEFSGNFDVAYFGHYKRVTVTEPYPGGPAETYILVQCGTPNPDLGPEYADAQRITVPVQSIFAGSTAQAPSLVAVDGIGAVTGVAQASFFATPEMLAHIETGAVVDYQASGITDIETVVASRPDIVMAGGSAEQELRRIAAAGIPVVQFADWLDTSPLGRAEWVKFMGLFFNAEAKANMVFDGVVERYEAGKALVADLAEDEKPSVLSGQAFDGIFYAAGGQSFMAQLIADAGGHYVFADDASTGSIQIGDMERLMARARTAEVWVQAAMTYRTLGDIAAEDPRLAAIAAVAAGNVWAPDLLRGPNDGVQFYELGNLRPDLVLMDLIAILHPDRVPGHQQMFNRAIAAD